LVFAPLADAYRKEGDLKEAFAVCKKGLERHPAYTSARVVLGRIFQEQGKSEEAVSEFKKVLEVDSENLMAHSLLGSIYLAQGDYQTAIEEYQQILSLNPDDENAQSSLKQAIEKAAGDAKPQETSKPTVEPEAPAKESQSTGSLTLGELYLKQGHFDKAIEVFQELLAKDPQNLMIRQKLSEVMEKQQKEAALGGGATAKLKKNEFTQPPDQKEDVITEEVKAENKKQAKPKKEDDSKFTSEDILQVMRRGSKDDAVVEEKKTPEAPKASAPKETNAADKKPKEEPAKASAPEKSSITLKPEQIDGFKDILAELGTIDGIQRCFLIGNDGINVVSIGETSNNADLGKQAVAIFQSTHRSVSQLNQGKLQQVLVTADSGNILLVSLDQLVLIVLANDKINLGLLRITLDNVLKKMEKII
jgi:tetratricopeptide (TPR) repeat protein